MSTVAHSGPGEPRPFMRPDVTELPRRFEAVTPDTFIDDLRSTATLPPAQRDASRADRTLAALVCAARAGDEVAWTQLIERFEPLLRRIARSYRLAPPDVDDVVQTTWLRLHKSIGRIREPAAVPGWLATTVRRESLRLLQAPVRELLTDDPALGDTVDADGPEVAVLAAERRAILDRALRALPPRQRDLMLMLIASDGPRNYRRISARLSMPTGSIGPSRARVLSRLAAHPELQALHRAGG